LQHTRIAVALARGNFLLFFSRTTIENSHLPKRQLYASAANESTLKNRDTTVEVFRLNILLSVPGKKGIGFCIFCIELLSLLFKAAFQMKYGKNIITGIQVRATRVHS